MIRESLAAAAVHLQLTGNMRIQYLSAYLLVISQLNQNTILKCPFLPFKTSGHCFYPPVFGVQIKLDDKILAENKMFS